MPKKQMLLDSDWMPPWQLAGVAPQTPVLLALSGGADSRLLLDLLWERSRRDGFSLTLAHVNHGIRKEETWRDRAFCASLAKQYSLEICILDTDIPALAAADGKGLEEEARAARYAYFERLMREKNIPLLVTAHHADDNLETVLFRLCRGSGLSGLCGIAPVRAFANGYLVRPLLHFTRQEILSLCTARELSYVSDSTNCDTTYARNRIRADVVPVLESLFDGLQKRVADMTASLSEDEAYLSSLAEKFLKEQEKPSLSVKDLRALPLPVRTRALSVWAMRQTGCGVERIHLRALSNLIDREEESRAQIAMPGGAAAVRECGRLCILKEEALTALPFSFPFTEGTRVLADFGICVTVKKAEKPTKVHNLSTESSINLRIGSDIIERNVYWRSRLPGDMLLKGGMHRKLCKLYNAAKIPPRLRDGLPILCDESGILWAPFAGVRDHVSFDGEEYEITVSLPET